MDGCRPDSELLRGLREKLGVRSRKDLLDFAVRLQQSDTLTPGAGALVTRAAEAGDQWAREMLLDAAGCLFRLGREAIVKLEMEALDPLPVGIWGSVLMQSAPVREELFRLLCERFELM